MSCLDVIIRLLRDALKVVFKPLYGAHVRFSRLGGASVRFEQLNAMCAMYDRIKPNVGVSIGLICSVGVGKYEYLACSDLGYIRTFDKGFIIVPKR